MYSIRSTDSGRLTDKYFYTWSDFYPSRVPCVYKSGPAWEVNDYDPRRIIREPRTVCRPDIAPLWVSILQQIIVYLDSMGINFNCINPFGWANKGEKELLCPFLLSVSVAPRSLDYDDAVAAAVGVKAILTKSGLPEAEVAFVEMVNKRLAGGPKLLPLDPILNYIPEYRKHFSSALGLPVALLDMPYYEGTGALYFRLGSDSKDIALLTCAHVIRPPPAFPDNKGMKRTNNSRPYNYNYQPKEYMVALGASLNCNIEIWESQLKRNLPAERFDDITYELDKANNRFKQLDAFHTEVTKFHTIPQLRTIGWALYSSPIQVPVQPLGYTEDWGLIQLYHNMIDEETFLGNKVFIGDKIHLGKFARLMFPDYEVRERVEQVLLDRLLQACGVVSAAEISNPKHLDANGEPCLFVVKNGGGTGTTLGRANGLESVKRTYPEHGIIKQDSLEIAVVHYGEEHGEFADAGDSGAIVLTREGKILGMLTGGAGLASETDVVVTWVTPFWWLQEQIKKQYPSAFLYDDVAK